MVNAFHCSRLFQMAELTEAMKQRVGQAFIELLNNVGHATMNDQDKTLLKSRIADDAKINMLGRIQKLPFATNTINKIPTNTPISVVNRV